MMKKKHTRAVFLVLTMLFTATTVNAGASGESIGSLSHIHSVRAFENRVILGTHEGLFEYLDEKTVKRISPERFDVVVTESTYGDRTHDATPETFAQELNDAIARGEIGPVILGRDHHDVSGTDSPFRETSNIYDGSRFTADMAIQNVIGDSFRGATWVSIHNGGGVGWGEVINGGFGMLLDGSERASINLQMMLHWDVNNGIARRNWARNPNATYAIKRAMEMEPKLKVTLPNSVDDHLLDSMF